LTPEHEDDTTVPAVTGLQETLQVRNDMLQLSVCPLEHAKLPELTVPEDQGVMVSEAGVDGDDAVSLGHGHDAGLAHPNPSWVVCS